MTDAEQDQQKAEVTPPAPDSQIPRRIDVPGSAIKSETTKSSPKKSQKTVAQKKKVSEPANASEVLAGIKQKRKEKVTKKLTFPLLTGWILGGLCFAAGMIALFTYPMSGAILFLIGILLFPPISDFVFQKWQFKLSWLVKGAGLAFFVILLGLVQLRRLQAESISHDLISHPVIGKDTLKTGFVSAFIKKGGIRDIEGSEIEVERDPKSSEMGAKVVVGFFEISLDKARVDTVLGTINAYAEQFAGIGNTFVILDVSYKCIDKESRIPRIGNLFMNVGQRRYEFDQTETVTAPGWGLYFSELNPLTTKITKIVYKIPRDVKGDVYWRPGGNPDSLSFFCGRI